MQYTESRAGTERPQGEKMSNRPPGGTSNSFGTSNGFRETQRTNNTRLRVKQEADYIFRELTRSICPECKAVIDAQIIIRDSKVFMRKRCPSHDWFEGIISADSQMYVDSVKFNKPGTLPLEFSTEVRNGCPLDCGLCPEHKQHICLALIEVNTACNLNCPVCFPTCQVTSYVLVDGGKIMPLPRLLDIDEYLDWITLPTGPCPSYPGSPRCRKLWRDCGRHRRWPARRRPPASFSVFAALAWTWATISPT